MAPLQLGAPEALAASPVILPPATALIRPVVDSYLAANGLAGLRPALETVSLALGRGICLASDALWFISRGVVVHELDKAEMIELPTGARFLSGAVGMTRRQASAAPVLARTRATKRSLSTRCVPSPANRAAEPMPRMTSFSSSPLASTCRSQAVSVGKL